MEKKVLTVKGFNPDHVVEDFCLFFNPRAKVVFSNESVRVCVVEWYFSRIKNDLAAVLFFELRGQDIMDVHIVVAGARNLFGFTFGVYKSMFKKIHKFFEKFGV